MDTGGVRHRRIFRLVTTLVGIVVGATVGGVIAVNLVIFSGIDSGYESSIGDVFAYNGVVGLIVVAVLVAGPFVGGLLAWRWSVR